MAFDFKFDPVTKDLVRNANGSYDTTPHADTMLQHQFWCHAGKCWHDKDLGSFFFDLRKFQTKPEVLVPDEARRCMNVLASRGRISNIEVTAERRGTGRIDVATKSRDTSTGKTLAVRTGG